MCFIHIDFEMCFGPQQRALFRHVDFQKCSGHEVFLSILTLKIASRHNSVQFFISHVASWLRTRRFSEPTFRPSGATNHWKKHLHLLSSDSFSSVILLLLLFSSLLFSFLTLPTSAFSSVHVVGRLTSKTSLD